jgi:hypothetical protein
MFWCSVFCSIAIAYYEALVGRKRRLYLHVLIIAQNMAFFAFWSIIARKAPRHVCWLVDVFVFFDETGGILSSSSGERMEHLLKEFYLWNSNFFIFALLKVLFWAILCTLKSAGVNLVEAIDEGVGQILL